MLTSYTSCGSVIESENTQQHDDNNQQPFLRLKTLKHLTPKSSDEDDDTANNIIMNLKIVQLSPNLQYLFCSGRAVSAVFACTSNVLNKVLLRIDEENIPESLLFLLYSLHFRNSLKALAVLACRCQISLIDVTQEAELRNVLDHFRKQWKLISLTNVRGLTAHFYHYLLTEIDCKKTSVKVPDGSPLPVFSLPIVPENSVNVPDVFGTISFELKSEFGFDEDLYQMPESIFDVIRSGRYANLLSLNINLQYVSCQYFIGLSSLRITAG